ncbi:MAG: hypothetical protein IT338_08735 [Thermomicrobiales bacterium]|nr:hypothetical protein [Thermomicrobiales bacterium]
MRPPRHWPRQTPPRYLKGLIAYPGPVSVADLQQLPVEIDSVSYIAGETPRRA